MNCLRSLVFIKKLDKKYRKYGLEAVIIHTPEWEFEKDRKNIEYAVKKYNINFPIIIDKNRKLIKKFRLNFWPTQILMSKGKVIYKHIGEGSYKELENNIIRFLKIKKLKRVFHKEPDYSKYPAIYLGKRKRGKIQCLASKLKVGVVYAKGKWLQKSEFLENNEKNNSLTILTEGETINFVAKSLGKPAKMVIRLNNKAIKSLTISKPELYKIVKLKNQTRQKLTLTAKSRIAVYSFSFQ